MAKESFGEDYVDSILQSDNFSDASVQELSDQEEQLILQYDNLSSTFTLLDNGKRWTLSEIENDLSLSNDEYYRLYDAYCAELNRQAGDIFLQLVQLRSQIATKLGYANYSDYCYESYGRDYTPSDARKPSSLSTFEPDTASRAPCPASARAIAEPIPPEAPVTSAVMPARSNISILR